MDEQLTSKVHLFKSRYIVDVIISRSGTVLVDSSGAKYVIGSSADVKRQFKAWFNTVFSKGIPQHLTVVECERRETDDHEVVHEVSKFLNVSAEGGGK